MSNYTITFDCNYEEQQWWRFAYDNNGLHDPETHSCLIGCVGQQDHVMENTFQVPAELDGARVTDFKVTGLNFGLNKNAGQWTGYGRYEGSNSTAAIYGVILQLDGKTRPANFQVISSDKNKFKISEAFKDTQKSIISTLSEPLILIPGKNYKIYLFVPDSSTNSGYWWPSSHNTGVLNISCEYTTYTKLNDPTDNWGIEGKIKSESPNKTISANVSSEEYLSHYKLTWGYVGSDIAFGRTDLKQGETYIFDPKELIQGKEIWFKAQAIHSKDINYNSNVKSLGSFTVNNKPQALSVSLETSKVLPLQGSTYIKPKVNGEDADPNDKLVGYFQINDGEFYNSEKEVLVKKEDKITYYVNDGIEDSDKTTISVQQILNLELNTAPVLSESDTVVYNTSNNQLTITKTKDYLYKIRAIVDGVGKNWYTVGSTQIQLEEITGSIPFQVLSIELMATDAHGDSSNPKTIPINRPGLTNSNTFLKKIVFSHNLGGYWTFDLENFEIKKEDYSIGDTGITINNPNILDPNKVYSFSIIGKYNERQQWRWDTSATAGNFIKFLSGPRFGENINPWNSNGNMSVTATINNSGNTYPSCTLVLEKDGVSKTISISSNKSSSSDTLTLEIQRQNFYNAFSDTNFKNKFGTLKGKKVINSYLKYIKDGITFTSPITDCIFDLDFLPALTESHVTFTIPEPIAENEIPQVTITNYPQTTQDDINLILYVDRGMGFVEYSKISKLYDKINGTHSFTAFGQISDELGRKWKIELQLASNKQVQVFHTNNKSYEVLKHIAPSGFIPKEPVWSTVDGTDKATIKFDINWGTNNLNSLDKVTATASKGTVGLDANQKVLTYTPPLNQVAPYKDITLTFTTTYGNTSKQLEISGITIYKDGPTVAYRKHSVGINTSSFESNAILTIEKYDTKDSIYLNNTHVISARVNCGTWSKDLEDRDFGIIRSDLAAIAYTGNVNDLKQTGGIIITGGQIASS